MQHGLSLERCSSVAGRGKHQINPSCQDWLSQDAVLLEYNVRYWHLQKQKAQEFQAVSEELCKNLLLSKEHLF